MAFNINTSTSQGERSYVTCKLVIPDQLECLSKRARQSGGARRTHPSVPFTTTDRPPVTKACSWQLTSVRSNPHSAKVTFRSRRPTFSFLSRKNGYTQTGESQYEFQNAQEKEVDAEVVDFQLQGIEVYWNVEGQSRKYTPDVVTLHASGTVTAEEVKASKSYFAEPEYRCLMDAAAADLSRVGIGFRKVTGHEMERACRRRYNIERAFMDRSTTFAARHVEAVQNLFATASEQPMGRVYERLKVDSRIASMMVNAMMCARHLTYDLNLPVNVDTLVRSASKAPAGLPDIRTLAI